MFCSTRNERVFTTTVCRSFSLRLIVTFVISAFSYRWIEAPIRERRLSPKVERWGLGICVVGLAAAILIVTVVFAPSPKGLAAISGNGEVLGPITEDPEALRVLVVGDSVASTLAFQHPAGSEQGTRIAVKGSTLFGCGIVEGDIALEGDWYPAAERCEGWPALWAKRAEELKPHVVVVLLGAWEVYDRRYNGATLKVGTPAYAAYLSERLELAIEVLSDQGKRPVVLLTAPCYQGQLVGERRKWKARNDPRRRDAVNRVIRQVATPSSGGRHVARLAGLRVPDRRVSVPGGRGVVARRWRALHRGGGASGVGVDDSPVGSFGPLGAPGDSIRQSHLRSSVPTSREMKRAFEARKSPWGPPGGEPPLCSGLPNCPANASRFVPIGSPEGLF